MDEQEDFMAGLGLVHPTFPSPRPKEGDPLTIVGDVENILQLAHPLESAANRAGIHNVFDDGGLRTLLLCTMLGISPLRGRLGDDACDLVGRHFELKTVNLKAANGTRRRLSGVSSDHSLSEATIDRYTALDGWIIGVFWAHVPIQVWQVPAVAFQTTLDTWRRQIRERGKDLANPKFPWSIVRGSGHLIFEQALTDSSFVDSPSRNYGTETDDE
jgi:Restriction endonuclease PvuII